MLTHPENTVTLSLSFVAGVASLLSPCVLALIPVYLTYLSGVSAAEVNRGGVRLRLLINALLFVIGFTLVFVLLFGFAAAVVGRALLQNQALLRQISGGVVILFGLHTAGVIRLGFMEREIRANIRMPAASPLRSLLIGMAFAAGWTPCVGPVLGTILVLAANAQTASVGLMQLLAYSAGLAIPFLLIAVFLSRLRGVLRWVGQHHLWVSRITGTLLIIIGIMLYTNSFTRLASWFGYWQFLP